MSADSENFSEKSGTGESTPLPTPPVLTSPASPTRFVNRHPIAAAALMIAALVLFVFFGLLLVTVNRQPDPRNVPELLLAQNASTGPRAVPEPPLLRTNLSVEELAFGREQIARMVKDRPALARSVYEGDDIWQFCVRSFAGEAIGEAILWNDAEPLGDYTADHFDPYQGQKGYIRVRKAFSSGDQKGQPLSCEELWAGVVFEIENMRNHRAFQALYYRALAGQLSREEYILENTKLEYGALRRAARDYVHLWRPLARSRQLSDTPSLWGAGAPRSYEDWIALYSDPRSYPWDSFGRYYDQQVVPYLKSRGIRPKISH